ncbi:glutathione S-transferase C-terminal domain-containing protein [Streptomyces sp. ME19-01-6]|uniref:glutathione S-transferase C-terminal domain-containing protein n=1 Tax=Streptomyces sp. ME19-01-6 TaxID=3028686 RepID=UPI0029BD63DB|nr:glutathione S-transferase C-terminal domain-containing protein [Streptomyces sp. ME19-01-6]MDX3232725.1 glutathione S-transferase C-terminal domain-containing protein [Streptomyces sp. ME19-01-6]
MSETIPRSSGPAVLLDRRPGRTFRSRIGVDVAGGYYPAPHRYQVFLSPGCPRSLRVSITLDLLRLGDSVTTVLLPSPAAAGSLRGAYEATWHRYDGPLTVPALCDRWSGRVVSNHTPDILRDIADHLSEPDRAHLPRLRPPALAADIDAIGELIEADLAQAAQRETSLAALDLLDRRLRSGAYVLGEELTAADVDLWVALVHSAAAPLLSRHDSRYDRLRSYVRRLGGHPAFRGRGD